MTPIELDVIRYMKLRDVPVSWSELRNQFVISEGYLVMVIDSLKRKLMVMQDGQSYRLSSIGDAALEPRARHVPFEGRAAW